MKTDKSAEIKISINNKAFPLNPFVEELLLNINQSFIETLKQTEQWDTIEIKITR